MKLFTRAEKLAFIEEWENAGRPPCKHFAKAKGLCVTSFWSWANGWFLGESSQKPEERARFVELVEQGTSPRAARQLLGVSDNTARKWARQYGYEWRA